MSPSMDPHLYGRGCTQICIHMTQIYIVCLVAMSKFESSLHESKIYSSIHDCLYFAWICVVLVKIHDGTHMDTIQSVNILQNKLSC